MEAPPAMKKINAAPAQEFGAKEKTSRVQPWLLGEGRVVQDLSCLGVEASEELSELRTTGASSPSLNLMNRALRGEKVWSQQRAEPRGLFLMTMHFNHLQIGNDNSDVPLAKASPPKGLPLNSQVLL